MTDNVIEFNGYTKNDIDPNKPLTGALDKLKMCVVLGYEHDGKEYFAASTGNAPEVVFLVERFKHFLLTGGE